MLWECTLVSAVGRETMKILHSGLEEAEVEVGRIDMVFLYQKERGLSSLSWA